MPPGFRASYNSLKVFSTMPAVPIQPCTERAVRMKSKVSFGSGADFAPQLTTVMLP